MEFKKENYSNSFNLIGEAKVNDYTFKVDETSKNNTDYVYSAMGLNVFCGEKHGEVYSEMMGGYSKSKPGVIYAHGKDAEKDGKDDFKNKINVSWNNRFNEAELSSLGELCFIKIGIEKDESNKTIVKKFLSEYDAIAYLKEKLPSGVALNIKGTLDYNVYGDESDKVSVKKKIKSIFLSEKKPEEYKATFKQTVLLSPKSAGKETIDTEKNVMNVYAHVLQYVKTYKGEEAKCLLPIPYMFEYDLDDIKTFQTKYKLMFEVKKNVTEMTFVGNIIETGATTTVTYGDLSPQIKEYIDAEVYTLEEALLEYTDGSKRQRMVITKPSMRTVDVDGKKVLEILKSEKKYTEEDLIIKIGASKEKAETNKPDVSTLEDELDLDALFGGSDG